MSRKTSSIGLDHPPVADPVTIMALGRGRVGKTTILNTLIQYYRSQSADVRVWNGDRQNESQSISLLHRDTASAPGGDIEALRDWLEERLQEQSIGRFNAFLDMAGGDSTVKQLAEELDLVGTMQAAGIRPVALHVVGAEPADLDYLAQVVSTDLFMPEATLIVLNNGLLGMDRLADKAYERVMDHRAVDLALSKGAQIVRMPALRCMNAVRERRLPFSQAATPRGSDLSFFDQARVKLWWERDIPALISQIPAEWMPAIAAYPATGTAG